MPSTDPKVNKRARDKWYRSNRERQMQRQGVRRRELAALLLAHKRTLRCEDCGMPFDDRPECCDFHHPDPAAKEGGAREMVQSSAARMWAELAKCVVLCANCHRTRHRSQR